MVRTNQSFLNYIAHLYDSQQRNDDIIVKSYFKGNKLLEQHENATKVILIKEGITKCYLTEENDKEYIIEFLGKGEIVGEIELLRKMPCLCSIQAITDVTVYAISIPYFNSLLGKDILLNNLLLQVFAERIINTSARASFQQLYTTEYSLSKLQDLQSKQKIEISKQEQAAYLGITIRSLNRAIKNLENI